MNKLIRDLALAGGLGLSILIVFGLEHLIPAPKREAPITIVEETSEPEPPPGPRLRLAVARPANSSTYDDIGKLLDQFGEGYAYTKIDSESLLEPSSLDGIDVVFLPCSGMPRAFLGEATGKGIREGTTLYTALPGIDTKLRATLAPFIARGGTIYASDLSYSYLFSAFPELVKDYNQDDTGASQKVEAKVIAEGLRDVIGERLLLNFELAGWIPALFQGESVRPLLEAEITTIGGATKTVPLLVKINQGEGTILFTSFHNETQNSESELRLLRSLVFAAITAKESTKVAGAMIRGGFNPEKENLLSASKGTPPISLVYHSKKGKRLKFAVGFSQPGALLRLEVRGPDGKTHTGEGRSTFEVKVDPAPIGDWTYVLTPVKIPDSAYPFTLTIGED